MKRPFVVKEIIKHVGYLSFVIVLIAGIFDKHLQVIIPLILVTSLFKIRSSEREIGYKILAREVGMYLFVSALLVEGIKYLMSSF